MSQWISQQCTAPELIVYLFPRILKTKWRWMIGRHWKTLMLNITLNHQLNRNLNTKAKSKTTASSFQWGAVWWEKISSWHLWLFELKSNIIWGFNKVSFQVVMPDEGDYIPRKFPLCPVAIRSNSWPINYLLWYHNWICFCCSVASLRTGWNCPCLKKCQNKSGSRRTKCEKRCLKRC